MSKVICDICGSTYSETADACPICGCSRNYALDTADEDLLLDEDFDFLRKGNMGGKSAASYPPRKNKEIFDYDEVNPKEDYDEEDEDEDEYDYDEELDDEEEPRSNTALIVILVVIIALLLMSIGFVLFRYFLPNVLGEEETTVPSIVEEISTSEETTLPTIPCQMLALTSDAAELNAAGQNWLLHVTVTPENTTDELIYVSDDESIATVSENGTITAVGEGETVINIICGAQTIKCPVVVDYDMVIEETEAEGGVPGLDVEEEPQTSDATEVSGTSETTETQPEGENQAAEATDATEVTAAPDAVLKINKTDITLRGWGTTYQLQLEGDIKPEDVEWITMNSAIAIVHDGLVTVLGSGTTSVIGTYGDQTVECIVRCIT